MATKEDLKTHVVSTFYRRPWGKGFRNISHTYGPYTKKDAIRHRKVMIEESKESIKRIEKQGHILFINVEPLRNEDNSYGADLDD